MNRVLFTVEASALSAVPAFDADLVVDGERCNLALLCHVLGIGFSFFSWRRFLARKDLPEGFHQVITYQIETRPE